MVLDLKKHLGSQIKKYLKASKVKQVEVAEALEISPSAVSQMLSGKMIPSLKQLDTVMQLLSLDRNVCAELRDYLARIRSGDSQLRSLLNDFIKSSRTSRGLSIEQLAFMTGIPAENINTLETCFCVQPTPYEAMRLSAIFDCPVSDLWQSMPDAPMRSDSVVVLHDDNERSEYKSSPAAVKNPVVKFEDLCRFNPEYDELLDFAWRHMADVESGYAVGSVIVTAGGAEFGWSDMYTVKMQIADMQNGIPGMIVLGFLDGDLLLAQAAAEPMVVIPLGGEDTVTCQWYWAVGGFQLNSSVLNNLENGKGKSHLQQTAVFRKRSIGTPDEVMGDEADNE